MRTVAVVLAGGSGVRLGGTTPKQLQLLAGRTLLEHCVAAFDTAPGVDEIVVVMPADLIADATAILGRRYGKLSHIIAGGTDRPGSTSRAIDLLGHGDEDCNVLFHDAARPLVDQRIIADCVAALSECEALGVVVPTADTIVEVADGRDDVDPAARVARPLPDAAGFPALGDPACLSAGGGRPGQRNVQGD